MGDDEFTDAAIGPELDELLAGKDELEAAWLEAAELAG